MNDTRTACTHSFLFGSHDFVVVVVVVQHPGYYRMEVDVLRRVGGVSRPLTLVVGGPTHSCKVSPETAYVIGELSLKRVEFAAQAVVFVEVLGLWVGAVGVAVAGRVLGVG